MSVPQRDQHLDDEKKVIERQSASSLAETDHTDVEEPRARDDTTLENGPTNITDQSGIKTATVEDSPVTDIHDVFWDGPDDPQNPMNFSPKIKWANVIIVAVFTFVTPLASSMFAPAIQEVMTSLHFTNLALAAITVSIYVLGYAVGPLIVAPLSESYGRLPVYHATNIIYTIFTVACALSTDVGMLTTFRFFAGAFGSTPLVLGGGTIADLIPYEKRAGVMSIWAMGPLMGPVVGPVAGGFLAGREGWRWVFWVIAIAAGAVTIAGIALMRETYAPVILEKKAARLRKKTGDPQYQSRFKRPGTARQNLTAALIRPMKLLIRSPITLILSTYMAIVYGYLYLLFTTITAVFEEAYHFSQDLAGLAFLGLGVGMFLGLIAFGQISKYMIKKYKPAKPEHRLPAMIIGGLCLPIGLFVYGWSAQYRVAWIVPEIGMGFVGIGLIMTFMPVSTYLIDAFTMYAASATAANTVLRSLLGALIPLAGGKMYQTLGLGWGNSLLAFIAVALVPIPVALLKYGQRIRERWPVQL